MRKIVLKGLDQQSDAIRAARASIGSPAHGWLLAVRQGLGLSQSEVAARLGITRQAYSKMENAEERGVIGIRVMQRAAEAMGCELTYFIGPRPQGAHSFADLARQNDRKYQELADTEHSMVLEGQGIGDLEPRPLA
jgi:predicted DNA-binding mobile mystery protein A